MSLSTPGNRRGLRLVSVAAIALAGAIFGESGAGSSPKPAGASVGSVRPADRPAGTVRDEDLPHGETVSVDRSPRSRPIEGAAGTTAEPEPYFSVTWTATGTEFSDEPNELGGRSVYSRRVVVSASTIVRRLDLLQDSFSPDLTVTDEEQQVVTFPCPSGGVGRDERRRFIVDPNRHQGIQSPTIGPIVPTQREDGSWFLPDPFWHVLNFTYRDEFEIVHCDGSGESGSSEQGAAFYTYIETPGDIEGDSDGKTFRKDISYDVQPHPKVPPMHVVWNVVARRLSDDLTVERLEVTQSLQDGGNGIPLVRGRRTVVRAYIGIGRGPGPVPRVKGILRGFIGQTELGGILPFNPGLEIDAKASPNWKNIDDTLNFEMPFSWTLQPSLRLEVEVNPEVAPGRRIIFEDDYTNNKLEENVTLTQCTPLSIGYLPIHYDPPHGHTPADPSQGIHTHQNYLRKVYPVSDTGLHYVMSAGFTFRGDLGFGTGVGGTALLHDLEQRYLMTSAPRPDRLIGWLPQNASSTALGLAHEPGTAAWVVDQSSYQGGSLSHELAHTYGQDHADVTTGGRHWFDVRERKIQAPRQGGDDLFGFLWSASTPDVETWAAPQHYVFLFNELCPGGAAAAQSLEAQSATVGDNLLIGGFVDFGAPPTGSLDPLYWTSTAPTHIPDPPSAGPGYCIKLKDGAGTLLAQYCFDVRVPAEPPGMAAATRGPFALVVPNPAGLARVELTLGTDTVLAFRTPSANPPSVTLTYPSAPGLTLSGMQNVTWNGSDPDGDPLTYSLLYSADKGATWRGLDSDLTTTTHSLDFSQLPGGAAARIRVLASDGFHTAQDDSDNAFAVGNKGPVAAIVSPPTGQTFNSGQPVTLQGEGSDLEDGSLGNAALAWSSDRDGALGTGQLIEANLSTGAHVITLTATDSNGLTATDSIALTVAVGTPGAPGFYTVTPCRVADTRDPNGPYGGPALAGGAARTYVVGGRCDIPATAKAISMNVTAILPANAGYVSLYPGGTPLPLVSTINFRAGQVRANNAIVPLGAGGTLAVFCSGGTGSTHFVIDVNGYFE